MPIRDDDDARGGLLDEILRDLSEAPLATGDELTEPACGPSFRRCDAAALHDGGSELERCDEPGCQGCAVCGFPTVAGYRTTCAVHAVGWVGWRPLVDCRATREVLRDQK